MKHLAVVAAFIMLSGSFWVSAVSVLLDLGIDGLVTVPDSNYASITVDINAISQPTTHDAFKDVYFLLYTQRNPKKGQIIKKDKNVIRKSNFKPSKPTRFIIHGWQNDHTSPVNTEITAAYLDRGDYNIIVVDWGKISKNLNYVQSSREVRNVGAAVAKFVDFLVTNEFTNFNRLVVIGHSLGAHVAGFTGKNVHSGRIQTLIGLDPAGPLFSKNNPATRIDVQDATYVEIIHTNGGKLGLVDPIGDSDFYPNYGKVQPGCFDPAGVCSHLRAYTYYAESLRPVDRFISVRCGSYFEIKDKACLPKAKGFKMGGDLPNSNLHGIFYLKVNALPPYARG